MSLNISLWYNWKPVCFHLGFFQLIFPFYFPLPDFISCQVSARLGSQYFLANSHNWHVRWSHKVATVMCILIHEICIYLKTTEEETYLNFTPSILLPFVWRCGPSGNKIHLFCKIVIIIYIGTTLSGLPIDSIKNRLEISLLVQWSPIILQPKYGTTAYMCSDCSLAKKKNRK